MTKYEVNGTKIFCQGLLPVPGFLAMAIFGVIFWRDDFEFYLKQPAYKSYVENVVNHENIHKAQMQDFCKFIPVGGLIFYLLYVLEWIIKLIPCFFMRKNAYKNLAAEVEAYTNEKDLEYISNRKRFAWLKNFFKITA